jgi:hypothetical protein
MKIFSSVADTRVVDGVGKSATDFAADALLLFLDEQVNCTGDENAIFACLRRVMEHDIMDARDSATAKTTMKVRPPTPQEQEAAQSARAISRVQGLVESLKEVGNVFTAPTTFAPAYRNKQEGTPESDEQLLQDQQKDLDDEGEQ